MEVGGWREIAADQNLRMAALMLDQQGQVNDLQAEVERLKNELAATADRAMAQGYELVGAQQELALARAEIERLSSLVDRAVPLPGVARAFLAEEARASVALDGETFAVGAERWVDPERPFPFLRSSPAADAEPETDEPVRHWCSFPCKTWVDPGRSLDHFGHVIVRGDA